MFDESERQCNKALLFDSDNSEAWCQLGHIYQAEGDRGPAIVAYERATEANPNNRPGCYALGTLYLQAGRYKEAIGLLEQVRSLGTDKGQRLQHDGLSYHKSALSLLSTCYEKIGDSAKARFAQEEMRMFYPDSISADSGKPQMTGLVED